MDVGAVYAVSQNPKIVSVGPTEAKLPYAMFATEQR